MVHSEGVPLELNKFKKTARNNCGEKCQKAFELLIQPELHFSLHFMIVEFIFKLDLPILPVPFRVQTGTLSTEENMYSVRVFHLFGLPVGLLRRAIRFS